MKKDVNIYKRPKQRSMFSTMRVNLGEFGHSISEHCLKEDAHSIMCLQNSSWTG